MTGLGNSGLVLLTVSGCARNTPVNLAQKASTRSPSPKAINVANRTKPRWIEGSWRGTGDEQLPFYERYKFENASTLVVETLAQQYRGAAWS